MFNESLGYVERRRCTYVAYSQSYFPLPYQRWTSQPGFLLRILARKPEVKKGLQSKSFAALPGEKKIIHV